MLAQTILRRVLLTGGSITLSITAAEGGFEAGFDGTVAGGTEAPPPVGGVLFGCSLTWLSTCKPPSLGICNAAGET